jgi:hypothetical protein
MDRKILKELSELNERLAKDRMYEIAVDEIENNDFDKVAQAIAFEEAEGDEKKARAFYTKHRVRRIKDEISYFVAELAATIEAEAKRSAEQIKENKARKLEEETIKREAKKIPKATYALYFCVAYSPIFFIWFWTLTSEVEINDIGGFVIVSVVFAFVAHTITIWVNK